MDNSLNRIMNNSEPFLNLIMGPMFSGKTTKLIHSYNVYVNTYGKDKCLVLNYSLDKRYTNEDKIFGVYTPEDPITLEKLHISIYDNLGATINNLKYTDNDQLTLVLKFFIEDC